MIIYDVSVENLSHMLGDYFDVNSQLINKAEIIHPGLFRDYKGEFLLMLCKAGCFNII